MRDLCEGMREFYALDIWRVPSGKVWASDVALVHGRCSDSVGLFISGSPIVPRLPGSFAYHLRLVKPSEADELVPGAAGMGGTGMGLWVLNPDVLEDMRSLTADLAAVAGG